MSEIAKTVLAERKNTHGDFTDTCTVTQELMGVLYTGSNFDKLHPAQLESLHMIQHKIARIVCGDPNFDDHWVDIIGYSQLVLDKIINPGKSNARVISEAAKKAVSK